MKYRALAFFALVLLAAVSAAAETIEGVVTNGTTGRPQPGATVELLKLDQGMEPIAQATTDSAGRYRLANPPRAGTGAPYLLRVTYAGVSYHQPARLQGSPTTRVDMEVFEKTTSERDLVVDIHGLSLEPAEGQLAVNEIFVVHNHARPSQTIFREGGTFRFAVPAAARELSLSVAGPTGMPLEQTPIAGKPPGQYLVDFPLRPGPTTVRLRYRLDYADARYAFSLKGFYPANRTRVFVPTEGVEISSKSLASLGEDPTLHLLAYGVESLPVGGAVEFEVRGVARESARQAAQTGDRPAAGSPGSVTIFPNAVAEARWYILAFAFFVLALGLYYLYVADHAPQGRPAEPAPGKKRRKSRAEQVDDHTLARH